ncbi:hypothetical protein PSTT_12334 [Puccinia striiformis]|uniref:OTU domain-containing protein n=1 Tax=Puccinia striiformis TaxID=27350 RepID=A0A2S4UWJ2_9BASI|nr:hypothetical protein PSTT_12334 [Puccinia striiformis]
MSQEISNPLPVDIQTHPSAEAANVSISPDVLMQIAQLLAAQKITIPALPSPVPSGSIKPPPSIDPLAASKPSTELLEGIFDEDDGMNEDDGMSLKSLDDLVPTKTTEGDLPNPWAMDPPPPMRFLSMEDLFEFVKRWSKHHGYGISKGNSHTGKNVYIRCDRGGTYSGKLENLVKGDSSTRKCECPFQVRGSTSQAKGSTDQSWHLAIMHGKHNHPASHCPSAHPSHRQLNPEQMKEVERLSKSNVKTTQILLQLRQSDPNTLAVNKTVNNALHKIREKELDGKTPIEALLSLLQASNWKWDVLTDSDGVIQNLFFAHPGSVHLAHINHHVALLDATYKTNRYNLPLLHVIGQTATNRSFSIAFCFLMYENDAGYLWAVECLRKHIWKPERTLPVFVTDRETALRNALGEVFPDSQAHLCAWHLNKNIVTNCRKHFPAGEKKANARGQHKAAAGTNSNARGQQKSKKPNPWDIFWEFWTRTSLLKTVDIYEDNLAALKQNLATRPAVLEYLRTSILPVKEHFIPAWASLFPHLRNLCTSRVESGHSFIKTFVTTSSGDLLSVWKALAHSVDHQIANVHETIGKDTIKTLTNIPHSFLPLCQKVSQHAILEANRQFKRLDDLDPTEPCSKTFSTGLGIPCCHMIAEILENRGTLEPGDFHSQWRLDYNPEATASPLTLSRTGWPASTNIQAIPPDSLQYSCCRQGPAARSQDTNQRKALAQEGSRHSTKRDPSAHEHVEAEVEKARKKRPIEPLVNSRKKVKRSGGVDNEEEEKAEDENNRNNKPTQEGVDNEEEGKGEDKKKKDKKPTQEVGRTTIKLRLPKKPIQQETEEKNEPMKEDNSIKSPYYLEIPPIFKNYVRALFNPKGDGHCGYRCLAKVLGYEHDGWFRVRQEISQEAESNRSAYLRVLGGEIAMNMIVAGILVAEITDPIPPEKWLNKKDHGQMIANAYGRPVVFLSLESCTSFFPTRLGPNDSTSVSDPVYLLHVSGNHWVLADVQDVNGMKPITPVVGSSRVTSQSTKEWKLKFQQHLTLYNQEVKRVKA